MKFCWHAAAAAHFDSDSFTQLDGCLAALRMNGGELVTFSNSSLCVYVFLSFNNPLEYISSFTVACLSFGELLSLLFKRNNRGWCGRKCSLNSVTRWQLSGRSPMRLLWRCFSGCMALTCAHPQIWTDSSTWRYEMSVRSRMSRDNSTAWRCLVKAAGALPESFRLGG